MVRSLNKVQNGRELRALTKRRVSATVSDLIRQIVYKTFGRVHVLVSAEIRTINAIQSTCCENSTMHPRWNNAISTTET